MILGTWNLEVYPRPTSPKGAAMRQILETHQPDVWFLTELHAEWELECYAMAFAPPRDNAPASKRKAAIASRWPMNVIPGKDHPAEGRLCLARLTDPTTGSTLLAASAVPPWRGAAPYWRKALGATLTYAEIYVSVLDYFTERIREERRPGEPVVWGGDFNQGLIGRDYVGTLTGRAALLDTFASFDLIVPTMHLSALIETHPAIDHIAIPSQCHSPVAAQIHRPERDGKYLSDHALYLVQSEPR